MATKSVQLSIPKPCHENWNEMNTTEKGAFCKVCTKEVTDFTQKTDREVIEYFEQYKTNTCGRFRTDQIDQPINHYTQTTTYSGWKIYLLTIASFIGLRAKADDQAHKKDCTQTHTICSPDPNRQIMGLIARPIPPVNNDTVVNHKIAPIHKEMPTQKIENHLMGDTMVRDTLRSIHKDTIIHRNPDPRLFPMGKYIMKGEVSMSGNATDTSEDAKNMKFFLRLLTFIGMGSIGTWIIRNRK